MFHLTPELAATSARAALTAGTLAALTGRGNNLRHGDGCTCAIGSAFPPKLHNRITGHGGYLGLVLDGYMTVDDGFESGTKLWALVEAHDEWAANTRNGATRGVGDRGNIGRLWPDLVGRVYDQALFLEICNRIAPPTTV
jgi:hypothetical protein